MKQRFTSIDVRAVVNELRDRVVNLRLQNVYDVNSKTFLLKFARSDKKELVLVESGIRIHSTQYSRDKSNMPSNFCMKVELYVYLTNINANCMIVQLRKHIRMRRLTNIRQLGTDRIVHFEFLGNEAGGDFHLFVEFYASGNIILTDHAFNIIALLRVVQPNESVRFAVREPYPLHTDTARRDWQPLPSDTELRASIRDAIQAAAAKDNLKRTLAGIASLSDLGPVLTEHAIRVAGLEPQLKVATEFDSDDASPQMSSLIQGVKAAYDMLVAQDVSGPRKGYIIMKPPTKSKSNNNNNNNNDTKDDDEEALYSEYHPFLCAQHRALPYKEFESFDSSVDEFYSRIESQKLETKTTQQEVDADKKLSKIKRDQFARASSLAVTQTENERRAELILENLDLVERTIKYVQHHVECGTDWTLLWRMIQNRRKQLTQTDADREREEELARKKAAEKEAKRARAAKALGVEVSALKSSDATDTSDGPEKVVRFAPAGSNGVVRRAREPDEDPMLEDDIALSLLELKLAQNKFILGLAKKDEEEEEEDNDDDDDGASTAIDSSSVVTSSIPSSRVSTKNLVKVSIDAGMTAYANARAFFDQKRQSAVKHEKTMAQADKAFKSAEKKIRQDLHQVKITATINRMRKPFWFEKFMWFISSEGYLVIAGRDMQQNELIVKRHLRKDDKYVHADLHGAATVVVKNPHNYPPPPSTMFQAGVMSVCQSRAWDAKMLASAYWVNADQVSKTAPSGEYLTTGSFMIRGKRNFLPPVNLVYGFGYLFKIDESCVAAHVLQRRDDHKTMPDGTAASASNAAMDEEQRWRERHSHYEYSDEAQNGDKTKEESKTNESDTSKSDKYALADFGQVTLKDTSDSSKSLSTSTPGRKHLSAKERRDLKKGKLPATSQEMDSTSNTMTDNKSASKQSQATSSRKGSTTSVSTNKSSSAKKPRGKGRKGNKKDHWSDSDTEGQSKIAGRRGRTDDQLGELVHHLASLNKAEVKDEKEKTEAEAEAAPVENQDESTPKESESDKSEEVENMEQDEEQDMREIRRLMAEENIAVLNDEDVENLSFMDALVGTPLPDDIIHFALPICAPYAALQRCKYRVKLQPGTLKKGKACKIALDHFLRHSDITPREREVLKSVPETEQIATILAKVRVVTGDTTSSGSHGSSKQRRKR
ncbi:fibronectin-binding protein A N-terminus-domain-containing protein [Syncephalis plumigaleata]|nr:fibronectin-binding protein A N-terminus-domain-containing protein [Syncephalis plumigaleata]